MPEIVELRAEPVRVEMKNAFETAQRRATVAENVRVTAVLADGTTGYGEGSPTSYVTGETAETVLAAIPDAARAVHRLDVHRVATWSARATAALEEQPTARSAVEMALLDALSRSLGMPLYMWFGGATDRIRTDHTIGFVSPTAAEAEAAALAEAGYQALKIKVGSSDRAQDLERVLLAARQAPDAVIRLDANQAFEVEEALAFVRECLRAGVKVEMLEQPVPKADWDALAAVTRDCPVPVIADEAVIDARAALRVASTGAAHGVNIKVAKAGLIGALQIIAIARAADLKLMLGCMLETLLGVGGCLHLACGTGAFDFIDLDAHKLVGIKSPGVPFHQRGEEMRVLPEVPGIGWAP
jgi:L-alanine-DL-glutamate epimerase-like enolase superfamily enzyme